MNRRFTLTTGIALSTLSLLYLGGSAYHDRAPSKVDTLGNPHAPTLGQADVLDRTIVFTDHRCPPCRAFESAVMPRLERRVNRVALSLAVVPIRML